MLFQQTCSSTVCMYSPGVAVGTIDTVAGGFIPSTLFTRIHCSVVSVPNEYSCTSKNRTWGEHTIFSGGQVTFKK